MQAGASHALIVVERVPAALAAAVDQLRSDGVAVEISRSAADAADRVHPDEALLVIGDGVIAGGDVIQELVKASAPALLVVPDTPATQMLERIDAAHRWAGLALLDGAQLRATAQMLGDWELETTLLRRAVQEQATRIEAARFLPVHVGSAADLPAVDRAIAGGARAKRDGWPDRFIYPLIESLIIRPLLSRVGDAVWLAVAAALLAVAAAPLSWLGWFSGALGLLLLSGVVMSLGRQMGAIRLTAIPFAARLAQVRAAGAGLALLSLGWRLSDSGQWGWSLAAVTTIAIVAALYRNLALLRSLRTPVPHWLATVDGLSWAALPFALIGGWGGMLFGILFYAAASFSWAQHLAIVAVRLQAEA
jgi:hypothetical protein